jgi:hypothetical protein
MEIKRFSRDVQALGQPCTMADSQEEFELPKLGRFVHFFTQSPDVFLEVTLAQNAAAAAWPAYRNLMLARHYSGTIRKGRSGLDFGR